MEKTVINNANLVDMVAEITGESKKATKDTLDAVRQVVRQQLGLVTQDAPIEIKLFSGVSLVSEVVPAHIARNPMTGESVNVEEKIKVRGKIYPTFNKQMNEV